MEELDQGQKEFLLDLLQAKMPDKNRMYYHCGYCGGLFADPERKELLIDLKEIFGKTEFPLFLEKEGYEASSSLCPICAIAYKKEIGLG